jgi:hypothetical protein
MINSSNDLKNDLINSSLFLKKISDEIYAQHLYAALCNTEWQKIDMLSILEDDFWFTSWRGSGHIVSDLRNKALGTVEDYMTYYCSGIAGTEFIKNNVEGIISEEIKNDLITIGWKQVNMER